jgi:hypothetical protein
MLSFLPEAREGLCRAMERQMLNFNIEWLEALWSVLALISASLSVYLWKRAAAVPSLPDQPALTSAWRARLHAQAGSAAAFAVFFLILLMISQVIEAMSGTVPPTIAWPPQSKTATPAFIQSLRQ